MDWSLRPAIPADAEALAASVRDAFAAYRDFAPPGWKPPSAAAELALMRTALPRADVWCLLAEAAGELAGHVALRPAATSPFRSPEPGLGHLWQLFVKPPWQGSGLALALHEEALREAGARGFSALRLFAAAGHTRARRFYEREGWEARGQPYELPGFGMAVVEYRRAISISV
jgi:GNAT superfamily N-acetyltransferase